MKNTSLFLAIFISIIALNCSKPTIQNKKTQDTSQKPEGPNIIIIFAEFDETLKGLGELPQTLIVRSAADKSHFEHLKNK